MADGALPFAWLRPELGNSGGMIAMTKEAAERWAAVFGHEDIIPVYLGKPSHPAAVADVIAERCRQIEAEGWTVEHDDAHANGELAIAAACYAAPGTQQGRAAGDRPRNKILPFWPWTRSWWKPSERRRDLVKAAALIIAEIERLDRAAKKGGGQ